MCVCVCVYVFVYCMYVHVFGHKAYVSACFHKANQSLERESFETNIIDSRKRSSPATIALRPSTYTKLCSLAKLSLIFH